MVSEYAHFLAKEGGHFEEADELFRSALKCSADDAQISLWYATFLRKAGRFAEVFQALYIIIIR